jgi:hypothetical protein
VSGDVVGGRIAVGLCEPALTKPDKHPRKPAGARRVVVMADVTRSAGQIDDDRHHQLGLDDFQKARRLRRFRVSDRFGDHPREPEGQHGVRADSVFRTFDRNDVRQPDKSGLRRRVMSL